MKHENSYKVFQKLTDKYLAQMEKDVKKHADDLGITDYTSMAFEMLKMNQLWYSKTMTLFLRSLDHDAERTGFLHTLISDLVDDQKKSFPGIKWQIIKKYEGGK